MLVSIIIPSYMNEKYLKLCIEHVKNFTKGVDYELIIIDNSSDSETKQYLRNIENEPWVKIIYNNKNEGYVKACNLGIKFSRGNVIVLLNNDVFVTPNWLSNLLKCLFHRDNVGAVSPVTNNSPYYQTIDVQFSDVKEMIEFAEKFNFSDEAKWEERLKLVGYCLVIKRNVIERIGLLDERFSPGNYEDDDYSIRMIQAGYKLFLCKDTFVYHVGGASFSKVKDYNILLRKNRQKFIDKWNIVPERDLGIDINLPMLIKHENKKNLKILEIGCGCGANLLYIKNKIPNVLTYGLEKKSLAYDIACKVVTTMWEFDEELIVLNKIKEKFDYIICLDIFKKFNDYKKIIKSLHRVGEKNFVLIVTIKNDIINDIPNLVKMIKQANLENDVHYLIKRAAILLLEKVKEIEKVLENDSYKVELYNVHIEPDSILEQLYNLLDKKFGNEIAEVFKIQEFILVAKKEDLNDFNKKKKSQRLKFLLRRLEFDIDLEETQKELLKLIHKGDLTTHIDELLKIIKESIIDKNKVLNDLAVLLCENSKVEEALKLLEESYLINPQHKDTAYNLAYLLYTFGQLKMAYNLLSNLTQKDNEIISLMEKIDLALRGQKS